MMLLIWNITGFIILNLKILRDIWRNKMEEEDIKKLFMLCQSTNEPQALGFDEKRYLSNIKYDGENIMAIVINNSVILGNRRGKICNIHFREVVAELEALKLGDCIINGEIISLDDDFNKLMQRAMTKTMSKIINLEKTNPVKFMVFDILKNQDKDGNME